MEVPGLKKEDINVYR